MSADELRRELRRLLPEFSAQLEEFRSVYLNRANPVPAVTYGEAILATISRFVTTYVTEIRNDLDVLDEEELVALHSVIAPVVDMRRQARESYERQRQEGGPT